MMEAILYVAGRAMRLGKLVQGRTKVMLEFGGHSLLERHIMLLAQVRVPKLFVVTGHLREQIQTALPALSARYGIELLEFYNPDFTEGSALSMHASLPALHAANDGLLLMDGDVLYDHRMLQALLDSPHATALLVDRGYSTADDDPVLVPIQDGKPFDFVKRWRGKADSLGESVGFFKIAQADLPLLIAETRARATGAGRAESYDDILRVLVKAGRFGAVDVTGIPWTEIDFPEDIQYAEHVIMPALEPFPGGPSPSGTG